MSRTRTCASTVSTGSVAAERQADADEREHQEQRLQEQEVEQAAQKAGGPVSAPDLPRHARFWGRQAVRTGRWSA
ncbi:hypothetical protein AB0L42_22365 [Streptomyces sp. NPDC052287]|uniref:hypothetical protein n=1 Tax=Streptomyces sp. NPDC052287 TaxID=3154950 RepID=UPI00341F9BEA